MLRIGVLSVALCASSLVAQEPPNLRQDLALVEQAYAARNAPDADEWKSRVDAKRAELASDLDWLIANNRGEDALRFVIPYSSMLRLANRQSDAFDALVRVLDLPAARGDLPGRERALYDAGILAFRRGDEARSREFNEESLAIARRRGDDAAAANALIGLSRIALRHHDYARVKELAQEAADLRHKIGDEPGRVAAMHMMAAAWRMEGSDAKAQALYETTLANEVAQGNKSGAAGERFNLGYVHLHQNHVTKADQLFRSAIAEYEAEKSEGGIAYCLTGLAAVAGVKKNPTRAAELYGAASAALHRLGITLDPDDQLDWDRYIANARRQLYPESWDAAYKRGEAMTIDQALAVAKRKS